MLAQLAGQRHPDVPLFVYGHSLGGLIALQYLTGTPDERIRGGVLSAPALDTSAATGAQKLVAPLLSRLLPNAGVVTLDLNTISRDQEVVQAYRADVLNYTGKIRARTGAEMMLAVSAMPQRLTSLTLPLLVLHGSADRLVPPAASEVVRADASSPDLTVKIYDGLYHELHNEPEQRTVLGRWPGGSVGSRRCRRRRPGPLLALRTASSEWRTEPGVRPLWAGARLGGASEIGGAAACEAEALSAARPPSASDRRGRAARTSAALGRPSAPPQRPRPPRGPAGRHGWHRCQRWSG